MTDSSGRITGDDLKRIWKKVKMSLCEVVYLYLPICNEENNENISTKIIYLRAEISVQDSRRYVLTIQRNILLTSV